MGLYTEREGADNRECLHFASKYFLVQSAFGDNKDWHRVHDKCIPERGYCNDL